MVKLKLSDNYFKVAPMCSINRAPLIFKSLLAFDTEVDLEFTLYFSSWPEIIQFFRGFSSF